jgi:hypothetical protein
MTTMTLNSASIDTLHHSQSHKTILTQDGIFDKEMRNELQYLRLPICCDVSGLKEHWDSDGAHVYYKPSPDDPEAWRDWLNPPDQANQDWKALAQAELQNALNVSMGIQHHQHWW